MINDFIEWFQQVMNIGEFADDRESDAQVEVTDITDTFVTADKLPDGDNRIDLPGESLDFEDLGRSLGSAFDPNAQNSVPSVLAGDMENDPSIFGVDVLW